MAALDVLMEEPEIIERLWENTRFFKEGLRDLGFNTGPEREPDHPRHRRRGSEGDVAVGQAVRARRVRAGDRVPDRRARQGARPHHRDRHAYARGSAVRARRLRGGRAGDRPRSAAVAKTRAAGALGAELVRRVDAGHRPRCHRGRPAAAAHPRHARRVSVLLARPRRRQAGEGIVVAAPVPAHPAGLHRRSRSSCRRRAARCISSPWSWR